MFWGCMIRYRLPFIEKGIRAVFEALGLTFHEQDGFSCCPEPNGIKNADVFLHNLTAIRNVALSERAGRGLLLTPCNGCFETLKGSRSEALLDPHLRARVNALLADIGLEFTGITDVLHILEFFARMGTGTLADRVTRPLEGLRVAVHYGCHFLRPSNKIQTDNPIDPHIFDELVEALGAQSIPYDDKLLCCGGSMARAGNATVGLDMVKNKLDKMVQAGAECIVLCCPQCFTQFDIGQDALRKLDYVYDLPVLYYTELLGLALGLTPADLGLEFHRQDPTAVLERIEQRRAAKETVAGAFDVEFLQKCYECGACNNDCPPARFADFDPQHIVGELLAGRLDEVVRDPMIWWCQDCYLCYELCPFKKGLVDVFTTLRNLARGRGFITRGFQAEYKKFLKTGMVAKFSKSHRKRLGLDTDRPELDDFQQLLAVYAAEQDAPSASPAPPDPPANGATSARSAPSGSTTSPSRAPSTTTTKTTKDDHTE